MRDHLELGPCPADEDCAQVGTDNYLERNRLECSLYIAQLNAQFPNLPDGVYFKRKSFPHDFGTYHEVVVYYDDDNPDHVRTVFNIEDNLPSEWSDTAKFQLMQAGYLNPLRTDDLDPDLVEESDRREAFNDRLDQFRREY